jgi:ribosomal protein L37E
MEEKEAKASKCPRCGSASMELDWKKGKAKCSECGYEVNFKK